MTKRVAYTDKKIKNNRVKRGGISASITNLIKTYYIKQTITTLANKDKVDRCFYLRLFSKGGQHRMKQLFRRRTASQARPNHLHLPGGRISRVSLKFFKRFINTTIETMLDTVRVATIYNLIVRCYGIISKVIG
jgi:hypothetical protein